MHSTILKEETDKPAIGGVPQSLRDRYGDAVNDLAQPKKPVVRKDSPAAEEAEKRLRREQP